MSKLTPRQPVPELELDTLAGERWRLAERTPENFTMVVAYRGLHCPICKGYLGELERNVAAFVERGVGVIAISSDTRERAEQTRRDWGLETLAIGYGLTIEKAREWGLYVSSGRGLTSTGVEEPALFNEPGIFLIYPDNTLYAATTATMPFARPHFRELLGALDFVIKNDYPARGEA